MYDARASTTSRRVVRGKTRVYMRLAGDSSWYDDARALKYFYGNYTYKFWNKTMSEHRYIVQFIKVYRNNEVYYIDI